MGAELSNIRNQEVYATSKTAGSDQSRLWAGVGLITAKPNKN